MSFPILITPTRHQVENTSTNTNHQLVTSRRIAEYYQYPRTILNYLSSLLLPTTLQTVEEITTLLRDLEVSAARCNKETSRRLGRYTITVKTHLTASKMSADLLVAFGVDAGSEPSGEHVDAVPPNTHRVLTNTEEIDAILAQNVTEALYISLADFDFSIPKSPGSPFGRSVLKELQAKILASGRHREVEGDTHCFLVQKCEASAPAPTPTHPTTAPSPSSTLPVTSQVYVVVSFIAVPDARAELFPSFPSLITPDGELEVPNYEVVARSHAFPVSLAVERQALLQYFKDLPVAPSPSPVSQPAAVQVEHPVAVSVAASFSPMKEVERISKVQARIEAAARLAVESRLEPEVRAAAEARVVREAEEKEAEARRSSRRDRGGVVPGGLGASVHAVPH